MSKSRSPSLQRSPLRLVGSTVFGRYPKISVEQTFNMIISDEWLVPYAGYKSLSNSFQQGEGRGIYTSTNFKHIILVINNSVYITDDTAVLTQVGSLDTSSGDVFISENNAGQIGICDKKDIYIFNWKLSTFDKITLDFLPGYLDFQDTRFLSVDLNSNQWRLSLENDGTSWPAGGSSPYVGQFQSRADNPIAVVRVPSKGNLAFVMGTNITELWYDIGLQGFPYQKNTYFNIDYGCLNPATIARNDQMVVWLAGNTEATPVIMVSFGDAPQKISTDGIDFKLAQVSKPQNSYGFLYEQDGHWLYQITFYTDNFSYAYDFNTKKFFTVTDEYQNYHIAKQVALFNNKYYFVSINDSNLYVMGSQYTTYDYGFYNDNVTPHIAEIPRIRVCDNLRMDDDQSLFVVDLVTFMLEQGIDSKLQRIDLTISKDGGESFSNAVGYQLNSLAHRQNKINFWHMGLANDFIPQFRFHGSGRFVIKNGYIGYHQ